MKKIIISFSLLIFLFSAIFVTGCESSMYTYADVMNLYEITKLNQVNNLGENIMFDDSYTINISYGYDITNITSPETENELNLYALNNIYNPLFESIFKYFENWHSNMEENVEKISNTDSTKIYNELNDLNEALIDLKQAKAELEDQLAMFDVNVVPSSIITSYIYELNMVVEKSIDFASCFRDIHLQKVYKDDTISSSRLTNSLDDMSLNFAKFAYYDNIRPFNTSNGRSNTCDLAILINGTLSGSDNIKLDLIGLDTTPSQSVIDALDTGENLNIINKAKNLLYFCDLLKQKICTLDTVMAEFDSYKLMLYRFGVISGGDDAFVSTLNVNETIAFNYLKDTEDFIDFNYLPLLNELI